MSLIYDTTLSPCPICGKKAYVLHIVDTYDRADYGWDAGCPSAKLGDGVHGFGLHDRITTDFPLVNGLSRESAILVWNRWVERWKEKHNA